MTARLSRLLILFAALVLVQLGGLSHGFSHLGDDADAPHPACELCGAYSAFDHALSASPPILAAPAPDVAQVAEIRADAPVPARSFYQPRAPPTLV